MRVDVERFVRAVLQLDAGIANASMFWWEFNDGNGVKARCGFCGDGFPAHERSEHFCMEQRELVAIGLGLDPEQTRAITQETVSALIYEREIRGDAKGRSSRDVIGYEVEAMHPHFGEYQKKMHQALSEFRWRKANANLSDHLPEED